MRTTKKKCRKKYKIKKAARAIEFGCCPRSFFLVSLDPNPVAKIFKKFFFSSLKIMIILNILLSQPQIYNLEKLCVIQYCLVNFFFVFHKKQKNFKFKIHVVMFFILIKIKTNCRNRDRERDRKKSSQPKHQIIIITQRRMRKFSKKKRCEIGWWIFFHFTDVHNVCVCDK